MITKSRITGQLVLNIFENFNTDRNLPKFKKPEKKEASQYQVVSTIGTASSTFISTTGNSFIVNGGGEWVDNDNSVVSVASEVRNEMEKKGRFSWFTNLFKRKKNVTTVFTQIFDNLNQVKVFKEREDFIEQSLIVAEKNGQVALAEKIKEMRLVHRLESQLLALDFIKVISEKQLVDFAYQCERGLRLDWMKNFTRNIPADVIEKKDKADSLKLFDNYVILHYDPDNYSSQLTKAEIEKKKDPILFGVFKESRKLYYIGDWIDDYCNLTFDDLIAKIGEENLKIKKEVV